MEDRSSHLTFLAAQMQHLPLLALENNQAEFHMGGGWESQHSDRTNDTASQLALKHSILHHPDSSATKLALRVTLFKLPAVHCARIYEIKAKENGALS